MVRLSLRPLLTAALVCASLTGALWAGERRGPAAGREPQGARKPAEFLDLPSAGALTWKDGSGSFPLRLDERLQREARRFADLAAPPAAETFDTDLEVDEEGSAARSRRVARRLTRALRGALDDHLSDLARTSPAFEGIFRILDARDGESARPESTVVAPGSGLTVAPGSTAPAARRLETDFRFKIDAHPRLQLRARMGSLTGSIEVPVLDPELRVGLERPLGTRGRAGLQGGFSDDRGGWAAVALNFSF